MTEQLNNVKAIKVFFEQGENGRRVTMEEMKQLTPIERAELGEMARKQLEKMGISIA